MNPAIRYQEGHSNALRVTYEQTNASSNIAIRNGLSQFDKQLPSPLNKQPLLSKHHSNNLQNRFYHQRHPNDITKSHRIEPQSISNYSKNQTNIRDDNSVNIMMVKATTNVYKTVELHRKESANDFFNEVEEQTKRNKQQLSQHHKEQQKRKEKEKQKERERQKPGQNINLSQKFIKQSLPNLPEHSNKGYSDQSSPLLQNQNYYLANYQQQSASFKNISYSSKIPATIINQPAVISLHPSSPLPYSNQHLSCPNCNQLLKQKQQMMKLMRQQLEIASHQYTDRINKVILQQAKQIKDMRKALINNEKAVIKIIRGEVHSGNINGDSSIRVSGNCNRNNVSKNIQGRDISQSPSNINKSTNNKGRQKSPSKLSLTKSNHSVVSISINNLMTNNHNNPKQKLSILTKQLSPSKSYLNNQQQTNNQQNSNQPFRKYSQQNRGSSINITTSQRMGPQLMQNCTTFTLEEVFRKIKFIQEKMQGYEVKQNDRHQKTHKINAQIQILQKGCLNFWAGKLAKIKKAMHIFMDKEEEKVTTLYKEIKVISSKIGTMAGSQNTGSCCNPGNIAANSPPINHATISLNPNLKPNVLNSSNPNSFSSPSINVSSHMGHSNNPNLPANFHCPSTSPQLNKLSIKVKNLFSELQDLNSIADNLRTKEFKYDNFQITSLSSTLREMHQKVYELEGRRRQINDKNKGQLMQNQ